jgi:hypothetical protein
MAEKREYRLKIDAYSPETMPMKQLAAYLADIAVLFGQESNVHLVAIEQSSTCPVVLVDWEAEPKVIDRITRARDREGSEDAIRAIDSINSRLFKDNASADLLNPSKTKVIEFPGAKVKRPVWPSVSQSSELYGIPIAVGGKGDPVPVHLLDGNDEHYLLAERGKAKQIAAYLFTATIRVVGSGRWRRLPSGVWDLERFVIDGFDVLKTVTFDDAVRELRAIDASWKRANHDPLAILDEIRSGEPEEVNGSVRQ